MKNISIISVMILVIILIQSCQKDGDKPTVPVVITTVTEITQTSAILGGNVSDDGGAEVTDRGLYWGTSSNTAISGLKATNGNGVGSFTSNMTSLTPDTKYYVQAYATNSVGTAYGDELSFTTQELKDADDNIYTTISIGNQVWMVENLKTTKYNDATPIPTEPDNTTWMALRTPAYCWYNNDINYKNTYGALYNWYTVNTDKLCPSGWHVPTEEEWVILENYLGESEAGGKMKTSGTIEGGDGLWRSPNLGADNSSGFSAVPAGRRWYATGEFEELGYFCYWWSSTPTWDINAATGRATVYSERIVYRGATQFWGGYSVRCIQDN